MIDTKNQDRLCVSTAENAGPYIMLPVSQLSEVQALLDSNNVGYCLDTFAISLDGKPEVIVINLDRATDAASVQRLLDSVR